jgi:hypothetical protein
MYQNASRNLSANFAAPPNLLEKYGHIHRYWRGGLSFQATVTAINTSQGTFLPVRVAAYFQPLLEQSVIGGGQGLISQMISGSKIYSYTRVWSLNTTNPLQWRLNSNQYGYIDRAAMTAAMAGMVETDLVVNPVLEWTTPYFDNHQCEILTPFRSQFNYSTGARDTAVPITCCNGINVLMFETPVMSASQNISINLKLRVKAGDDFTYTLPQGAPSIYLGFLQGP